jgi:hypothetical protein
VAPPHAGTDKTSATPATTVLTPELMAAAMKIAAEDNARHAAAQAELERIAAEEEVRRQQVLADLAKARTIEDTRAALGGLLAAVTTAYLSLAEQDVDEATVTAGLEAVYAATNDLKRASRIAPPRNTRISATGYGSGTVTVRADRAAPRPLRPEVAAHLATYPDKDFTPGEIGKVLDRSSGAVANALDKLVQEGQAVLTSEKPHRYRAATPIGTSAHAGQMA